MRKRLLSSKLIRWQGLVQALSGLRHPAAGTIHLEGVDVTRATPAQLFDSGLALVPEDRQIEVPKYVRPRTDTPELAFGWGGAFAAIYPVRGAGGYQLLEQCLVRMPNQNISLPQARSVLEFMRSNDGEK